MAMTETEIQTGLGEIIDEVAGVPADEVAQDKFGVDIPDDELKNLKTVQDVIDYVRRAEVSA